LKERVVYTFIQIN